MNIESIYEEEILELISSAWDVMTPDQRQCWERIKIDPEKWTEERYRESVGESWGSGADDNDEGNDEDSDEDDFDGGDHQDNDCRDEKSEEDSVDDGAREGVSFWVVAVLGETALWYNDVEEGFNLSPFKSRGEISEYHSKKDDLEVALQRLMTQSSLT